MRKAPALPANRRERGLRLRHTRLATTADVYTHVFEETQRAAADSMDSVLIDLAKRRAERKAG